MELKNTFVRDNAEVIEDIEWNNNNLINNDVKNEDNLINPITKEVKLTCNKFKDK